MMDSVVLAPLDALEASLNSLISSITTTQSFAAAPAATKDLLAADDALTSALTTLKQHQNNYARIIRLQAEAARLQDQIKSIVRTCGDLRREIGSIHSSILDESDSDDEDTASVKPQDIDYRTLLAFAARIGKHNAVAAREAEQDSLRHRLEARREQTQTQHRLNGDAAVADEEANTQAVDLPEESRNDLNILNNQVAADRAAKGMAFPAAESLRLGVLGQLQLIREEGGEDAVEREVERMIEAAEHLPAAEREKEEGSEEEAPAVDKNAQPQAPSTSQSLARPPRAAPLPVPAPRKIKLDLWDEDEDDDD